MNKRGKTICASKHTKLLKKCNIIRLESIVENMHLKVLKEKQNVKKILAKELYSIFMGQEIWENISMHANITHC